MGGVLSQMCLRLCSPFVDVLDDLLTRARAEGALFAHSRLRGDWGLAFPGDEALSLHAVLAGELWCERAGRPGTRVRAGQLALLRGGTPAYRFVARPGGPARPLRDVLAQHAPGQDGVLDVPGEGPATELLCGAYTFHGSLCDELLAAVPELAVVDADDGLRAALAVVRGELVGSGPGRQVVLDRALDVLLIGCLRVLWRDPAQVPPAWVAADPVVTAALRALHERPAHPWTVAELAAACRVSRAALARRFAAQVGVPPLAYLTRWRMQLAQEALRDPRATLRSVAREVGYADAYAFATAFKREIGTSPGRWRTG